MSCILYYENASLITSIEIEGGCLSFVAIDFFCKIVIQIAHLNNYILRIVRNYVLIINTDTKRILELSHRIQTITKQVPS